MMFRAIVAKLVRASFLGLALAFVFSTGAMAAPAVYSSGIKVVAAGYCLDFDALVRLTCNDPTADIGYTNAGPGTTSKLGPVDATGHVGAQIKKMNATKPSFTTCANAAVGWNDYARTSIPVGTWFCALTNGNRVARFKVLAISNKSIQLKVTVWSNLG
jgi:hypothetical protein